MRAHTHTHFARSPTHSLSPCHTHALARTEAKANLRPWSQSHHNPYSTLSDIVNENSGEYDAEADNLTLFTAEGHNTAPKVAQVLGNLVRFPGGENPTGDGDGELSAKKSMLALLKKAVR